MRKNSSFSLKLVFTALFIAGILNSYAQQNAYNEVSIASPTAASLGKYADIPVNFHTGIPNISIPIYTIKEGPLTVPISLSYHAGGLRVLEPAGWVGTGWSLQAGGVITRTVQGAPDERNTSTTSPQTHGHLSDNGYNNYLWIPESYYGYPYPPTPPQTNFAYRQEWDKFYEGRKDGEPDLFFFNFQGYSGKFFFSDDGKAVLMPEQDLKIDYNYTPGIGISIASFVITTPDGTQYSFGRTPSGSDVDPVEITNPYYDGTPLIGQVISSWYLNKITSQDGLFNITFTYASENYSYYALPTFPVSYDAAGVFEYKMLKNIVSGVRLTNITFTNGKVDFVGTTVRQDLNGPEWMFTFDNNTQSKALDEIRVSNTSATNGKVFRLTYSYFEDNTSPMPGMLSGYNLVSDRKRLKLNSVQEFSLDGTVIIPAHQFEYFTDFVPRRISFAQDHWGFYNGATTNSTLIPTYTVNTFTEVSGANRDPAWPAMSAAALKKITYPTGGYTEFEFEQNYTWVSYNKGQWTSTFNIAAGYDGSSNPVTQYQDFTAITNTYKLTFTNSSAGQQAFLKIYKNFGDYAIVKDLFTEPGQTYVEQFTLSPGNYRVVLQKTSAVSGQGAMTQFQAWATPLIQENKTVGGLRIKTITHNDGVSASNNMVTNYSYMSNGKSTGMLYSRPTYVYRIRNDIMRDVGFVNNPGCNPEGCVSCGASDYMKSPNGFRPMETTQGNHIGYNEVKVSQTGNGYKIYKYYGSNVWDLITDDIAYRSINTGCESTITNYPFAPLPHEFKRGELKYEGFYNESGQMLKETEFYPVYVDNPMKTPGFICGAYPNGQLLATFYEMSTARKTETQIIERVNTPGVGTIQTSNYAYFESAFHNQVTRKVSTSSTGEILETKFKYAADFRVASCDAISNCLSEYNTAKANALSTYNTTIAGCSNHTCRWWAWHYYIKALSDARNAYTTCRKTNYTGPSNAFTACLTNAKNAGDAWLKPILDLQLVFNNAPIEVTDWRAGKLLSGTFNKYDYAVGSLTGIYPNKVLKINLASPSTTFTPAVINATTITKDSRYADETTVRFYFGNLVEITPKAGVTTSYVWGHNNTLPVVKAVGVDQATLNAAYGAVGGNLSVIRSYSTLTNAMVNTYAYDPFVGMTSEGDPNSRNTYYEYDKLQRLSLIRDHDNNILKRYCYGYAGQAGDCNLLFFNEVQSGNFTRNNCCCGYTGGQVTYTVPAGTYSASSLDAANTLAQNDVNANGQAYANANGTCTPPPVNVQGYNSKTSTYQVRFTNNSTGVYYNFYLNPNTYSFSTLGQIPQGTYTVLFYPAGSPVTATFNVNGSTQSGTGATFNNVNVSSTTSAYMY